MAGPIDTLGKAVRHNMLITAECECGNTRHYRAIDVGMAVGFGRHPESVRFGCLACDRKSPPTITLRHLDEDRLPKLTVWRFSRGKGGGPPHEWTPEKLRKG